jgi:hypothetical protein
MRPCSSCINKGVLLFLRSSSIYFSGYQNTFRLASPHPATLHPGPLLLRINCGIHPLLQIQHALLHIQLDRRDRLNRPGRVHRRAGLDVHQQILGHLVGQRVVAPWGGLLDLSKCQGQQCIPLLNRQGVVHQLIRCSPFGHEYRDRNMPNREAACCSRSANGRLVGLPPVACLGSANPPTTSASSLNWDTFAPRAKMLCSLWKFVLGAGHSLIILHLLQQVLQSPNIFPPRRLGF